MLRSGIDAEAEIRYKLDMEWEQVRISPIQSASNLSDNLAEMRRVHSVWRHVWLSRRHGDYQFRAYEDIFD
jgi:hypothetical protein